MPRFCGNYPSANQTQQPEPGMVMFHRAPPTSSDVSGKPATGVRLQSLGNGWPNFTQYLRRTCAALVLLFGGLNAHDAIAEINWQKSPTAVLESAKASGKPILVFIGTDWCHYCKLMERETWSDPSVSEPVSQQFETLMLDGDRDRQIVERLGLQGYPATLLYTHQGRFATERDGFMPATQTIQWLEAVLR